MKKFVSLLSIVYLIFFVPLILLSQSDGDGWDEVFTSDVSYAIKTDGTLWVLSSQTPAYVNFYDGEHIVIKTSPQQINTEKWKYVDWGGIGEIRLKADGTMWYTGTNQFGTLGDGSDKGFGGYKQIGNENDWSTFDCKRVTFAIKNNGTLWAWGYNVGLFGDESIPISKGFHPQPITQIGTDSDWKTIAISKASSVNSMNVIALKTDGSIWGWGKSGDGLGLYMAYDAVQKTPKRIIEGKWNMVNRGRWGTAAIRSDGTLWMWGYDCNNWLFKDEKILNVNLPTQYEKDSDWQSVSVGYDHILAIKNDGTLWSSGRNGFGEVGNGSKKPAKRLTQVGKDNDWEKVFAGNNVSFAIKKDGTLWSWGNNIWGGLGHGARDSNDKESQYIFVPTKVK